MNKLLTFILLISVLNFISCSQKVQDVSPTPTTPTNTTSTKLDSKTRIIEDAINSLNLESVSESSIIFKNGNSKIDNLSIGEFIVGGISTNSPSGYIM